jgi:adenylyltransferase/sulfurtransferase
MQSDTSTERAEVLLVGAGGIGAPAGLALVEAGVRSFVVVDDDLVERSNLHRQILYAERDVGRPKLEAFRDALLARAPDARIELVDGRLLPDTAASLVRRARVVIDAVDNFASRFLAADACLLAGRAARGEGVPVVHAAAVRWVATVMATGPEGRPCYRCLFEDVPGGDAPDCATAGVVGPVCGVAGALAAELALRILGRAPGEPYGRVYSYDGRRDRLREVRLVPRRDCALCGDVPSIEGIDEARYLGPSCEVEA